MKRIILVAMILSVGVAGAMHSPSAAQMSISEDDLGAEWNQTSNTTGLGGSLSPFVLGYSDYPSDSRDSLNESVEQFSIVAMNNITPSPGQINLTSNKSYAVLSTAYNPNQQITSTDVFNVKTNTNTTLNESGVYINVTVDDAYDYAVIEQVRVESVDPDARSVRSFKKNNQTAMTSEVVIYSNETAADDKKESIANSSNQPVTNGTIGDESYTVVNNQSNITTTVFREGDVLYSVIYVNNTMNESQLLSQSRDYASLMATSGGVGSDDGGVLGGFNGPIDMVIKIAGGAVGLILLVTGAYWIYQRNQEKEFI